MSTHRPRARHGLGIVLLTVLATVALLSVDSGGPTTRSTTTQASTSPTAFAADVTSSQWQAGDIISDSVFYNSATMTASSIQTFLNQEAPSSCPGTTCLDAYHMATTSQPAESGLCSAYTGKSSETAAQIFANVAAACGVNPQALLVIAQKESSAITSSSPNYSTTMGYGCPDSTGCASKYFGFFNQVYLAARQFKLYRLNPDNYGYVAGESNYILYNPKVSCGGSNVFIQNQATAGLYDYTPYQPDAAALANLHGSGDSCSAYGNRNFWVFFNTWFGSTLGTTPLASAPQSYDRGGILGTRTSDGSIWYYANRGTAPLAGGVRVVSNPQLSNVVATGDITGDGLADLLTASTSGALWMYQNTGTTQPFGVPTELATSGWQKYNRMVLADITGDGRDDLIVTESNGTAGYYLNTGNAAQPFGTYVHLAYGWQEFTKLTAGDVNSDGHVDLIATKADGSVWWLRSTGTAGHPFGGWERLGTTNVSAYNAIVGDDTNADGYADLVARKADGSLWVFTNSGSSTNPFSGTATPLSQNFQSFTTLQSVTVPVPHRTGQANLVVRNPAGSGSLSTFFNASPPNPFIRPSVIGSGWQGYRAVVAGNFTGSGRADLVAIDKTGASWLYKNTGNAARPYSTRVKITTGWSRLQTLYAGDVNGDGRDDLVALTNTGALYLYLSTGSSTAPFNPSINISTGGWSQFRALAVTDATGDKLADILATTADGQLREYTNNGSATQPFVHYAVLGSTGWQNFTHLIPITHATAAGVGPPDLVGIHADGSAVFYRNDGLPNRPYLVSLTLAGTPWASQVVITGGLVTGSGRTDTVGMSAAGALLLNANRGTDVYNSAGVISPSGWDTYNYFALGDTSGDGRSDLVTTTSSGSLLIYQAGTDPSHPFGAPTGIQSSGWQTWTHTLVGDVTGDGRADLITTTSAGAMWLYQANSALNHPYGGIPKRQIGTGWQDFTQLALGDVTGDGLDDLIGVKADGSLWLAANLHNPTTPFGVPVQIGTGFSSYSHLLVGDVDHDGLADIVGVRPDGTAWYCRNLKAIYPTTPFIGCVPTTMISWKPYDLAAL